MNPLADLLPALLLLLNTPALQVEGVDVVAYEHLPGNNAGHYVLVEQPTDSDAGGSTGCEHFSCTVLLNVVTQFEKGVATSSPVESLVTQINSRLRRKELDLGPAWTCGRGTLTPGTELREEDGEFLLVRRLLRYRWEVYNNGTPAEAGFGLAARQVQTGRIRLIHA
jgi:hypothetical protein